MSFPPPLVSLLQLMYTVHYSASLRQTLLMAARSLSTWQLLPGK